MYVAALVGVLLSGCTSRPAEISLARLVQEQEAFFGDEVKTRGTVRRFEDVSDSYYVLEDEGRNRVALVPASTVKDLVGEEVTVTGKFELKPAFGRAIEVKRILPDPGRALRGGTVGVRGYVENVTRVWPRFFEFAQRKDPVPGEAIS